MPCLYVKNAINEATKEVTKEVKSKKKEKWISEETFQMVEEKRKAHLARLDSKSKAAEEKYKQLRAQVKQSVKRDKVPLMKADADEMETARNKALERSVQESESNDRRKKSADNKDKSSRENDGRT